MRHLQLYTAGESHGPGLTAILEGLPMGLKVDPARIDRELARRQEGYGRGGRMKIEQDAAASGNAPRMSRKRLLTILAEVVQELCQPLSVISCSLGMISGNNLGDVAAAQLDMLKLAEESAAKMAILIDNLQQVAGLPSGLTPNRDIQDTLNKEG